METSNVTYHFTGYVGSPKLYDLTTKQLTGKLIHLNPLIVLGYTFANIPLKSIYLEYLL